MSMPVSVLLGLDGGVFEGGEPMMTMLRFSELAVMLAVDVTIRRDLRLARAGTIILVSVGTCRSTKGC